MGTPVAPPPPFTLAHHALHRPAHTALLEEGRSLDYRTFNSRVNRLAHGLLSLGLRRGDRAALMLTNRAEFLEATFAGRKAGLPTVPIGWRLKPREVRHILDDSDSRAVVFDASLAGTVRAAAEGLPGPEFRIAVGGSPGAVDYEELLSRSPDREPEHDPDLPTPGMFYTSGTTGAPKGAYRDARVRDTDQMRLIIREFGFGPGDVHLVAGPLYHSAPYRFAVMHLLLGATAVLRREFDPEEFLRAVQENRATTAFVVPTMLARINDLPEPVKRNYDLSSMRSLVVAGAPCPFPVKERAIRLFGPVLCEFYGATETGINTLLKPEEQLRKPGSCGRVFPGNEVRILDEAGNPVPPGQPGLLYVKNSGLITRYHKRPEATEANFRDGFFTVGDVARMDGEGFIYIVDRKIDMVISGGVNIYPAEIEALLRRHPAVADAAVIGVPDEEWGESLKAFVVRRAGAKLTAEEAIEFCKQNLASYKKPKSVEFVAELPYGPSGKVLKRELRERYWGGRERRV
ncbi:MAG: AMP-binding protein [Halobacteria archaeon]